MLDLELPFDLDAGVGVGVDVSDDSFDRFIDQCSSGLLVIPANFDEFFDSHLTPGSSDNSLSPPSSSSFDDGSSDSSSDPLGFGLLELPPVLHILDNYVDLEALLDLLNLSSDAHLVAEHTDKFIELTAHNSQPTPSRQKPKRKRTTKNYDDNEKRNLKLKPFSCKQCGQL